MEFCRGGLVDDMGYIEKHNLLANDVGSGVLDFFFPSGNTEKGLLKVKRIMLVAGKVNSWVFFTLTVKRNFKWESCLIRFNLAGEAIFAQSKFLFLLHDRLNFTC